MDPSQAMLSQKIGWIAQSIADPQEFEQRARSVAKDIGPAELANMKAQLHLEHTPPEHLQPQFPQLGGWLTARQFAVFEVLFYVGTPALPLVKEVAYGPYDWTQGNAIEILCRFAAQDPGRDELVNALLEAGPSFRWEALLYALGPLKQRATADPAIQRIIDQLRMQADFREAYDELSCADTPPD